MSIPDFSLEGKVAVVTGARRGIGKAIALAFAEAGADVAICDRVINDGELQAVAEDIQKLGRRTMAIQADTAQNSDVDDLVQKVIGQFTDIDILVNNAGIIIKAPFLQLAEADWDEVINVDLKGYFLCCQAVGKVMAARKRGVIINMASMWGLKATTGRVAYSVAKAGVVMLTRVLALELASYNIRVNAIAPTSVKTELSRHRWDNPQELERWEAEIPLGRIAVPDDIVGAALFLASDASNYITGQTIVVDGGRFA